MSNISIRYDKERFSKPENDAIEAALEYAARAHEGQKRASGEPYMVHPQAVAEIVADWGLDAESVMAALLHDVIEDTDVTLKELQERFGDKVAELVDGVTKLRLSNLPGPAADSARREISNENLRKLLLASVKDLRVLMVKLADRLHNLRTLEYLEPARQKRIARESLEIFAPLADRLGMGQLKAEMEDIGFKYAYPEEYARLEPLVRRTLRRSQDYLESFRRAVAQLLAGGGVKPLSIAGRPKHLYSVFKKLGKVEGDIEQIYDLLAVRIIVPDVASCYQVLGLVHQQYKPLIYRIKDYIAVPKPNGYQSLHTTVFGLDGKITEIQIRTPEMHDEAERGLAAHFFYDAQKHTGSYQRGEGTAKVPDKLAWVNQLASLQAENSPEALDSQLELFSDRIFVFSPKGDLYDLPEGSTPVDFAFAVHSDLGLKTMGARVNDRMVTLDTKLENRDVVEIMTRREPAPNRDWLGFVQTSAARGRIRSWFRAASRDANIASGRVALEAELKVWGKGRLEDMPSRQLADTLDGLSMRSADDLLLAIGEGTLGVNQAIRRLVPDAARPSSVPVVKREASTGQVLIEQQELAYTLAPCCKPFFPQPIVGYVTRGAGVTVHAMGCKNLPSDAERYVACRWETLEARAVQLVCQLRVRALNRIGLLSDITGVVARERLNISGFASSNNHDETEAQIGFSLEVPDLFRLADVVRRLERVPGVIEVTRTDAF